MYTYAITCPPFIDGISVNDVPVRLNIFGHVIQIKTEATQHDESNFSKRHKLALMAWKELSGEFGRLTVMNRANSTIGASADAIMLTFQATHIVNDLDLNPENVSKVIANLGDLPAVKLYRLRKLHEFDEKCAQERERLRLEALEAPSHSQEHQPTDNAQNPTDNTQNIRAESRDLPVYIIFYQIPNQFGVRVRRSRKRIFIINEHGYCPFCPISTNSFVYVNRRKEVMEGWGGREG